MKLRKERRRLPFAIVLIFLVALPLMILPSSAAIDQAAEDGPGEGGLEGNTAAVNNLTENLLSMGTSEEDPTGLPEASDRPTVANETPAIGVGGNKGYYLFHCNIDGAEVSFDEKVKGVITNGTLLVQVYLTATPYDNYSVSKEGYITVDGPLRPYPVKDQTKDINVTLTLSPYPDAIRTRPVYPDAIRTRPVYPDANWTRPGYPDAIRTRPVSPDANWTRPGYPDAIRTRPVYPDAIRTRPGYPDGIDDQDGGGLGGAMVYPGTIQRTAGEPCYTLTFTDAYGTFTSKLPADKITYAEGGHALPSVIDTPVAVDFVYDVTSFALSFRYQDVYYTSPRYTSCPYDTIVPKLTGTYHPIRVYDSYDHEYEWKWYVQSSLSWNTPSQGPYPTKASLNIYYTIWSGSTSLAGSTRYPSPGHSVPSPLNVDSSWLSTGCGYCMCELPLCDDPRDYSPYTAVGTVWDSWGNEHTVTATLTPA